MRCSHCNEKTAPHDIWCVKCGKPTPIARTELSAIKSIKTTWSEYTKVKGQNFPVGIIAVLTGVLPLAGLIWLLHYISPALPKWQWMLYYNLLMLFFLPLLFVPFNAVCRKDSYQVSVGDYFRSYTAYPRYLFFSFIAVLYYLVIFFICKGDPILNLVWLVLALYFPAIAVPLPVIMERYGHHAWKALRLSFRIAGDVRWNKFLLLLILLCINALALVCFVVGLAVTIPFTWMAIRDYTDKLIEFEVFYENE